MSGRIAAGLSALSALSALVLGACARPESTPAATAATTAATATAASASNRGITFIEDDYPRALAEARKTGRPLFIDAWAPWCHTCLSMRAYVFNDPALAPIANRFVFLAIDTEKPESAAFLAKFPMSNWPTLWVVDARGETPTPTLKWIGAATGRELLTLLGAAVDDGNAGTAGGEAAVAFVRGQQATAEGKRPEAIAAYRAAWATAPATWKSRAQVAEALAFALLEGDDPLACVEHARTTAKALGPGTSRANVTLVGVTCARRAGTALTDATALPALVGQLDKIANDMADPILADDRSSLFEELVDAKRQLGDEAAAAAAARAWAAFLEGEAQEATTPDARTVFDAHRLGAYIALGDPARALPMLDASERDFPRDYNPPARLARTYLELRRLDDALAAVDRALARVYGGRELRVALLKADILVAKGDRAAAAAALARALERARATPLAASYVKLRDKLAERHAELSGNPTATAPKAR